MREILFRGKRLDNGEWVEGSLLKVTINGKTAHLIFGDNFAFAGGDVKALSHALVDPSAVGQYTGLSDKNGKKIFDGDIVQYYGTYALEVFIEKGHTKIRWFDTATNSKCEEMFFGYDEEAYGECEVIGNIHDNPELLED